MDGFEAARHIRQQPGGRAITLVALTGSGQDDDKQRTKEAGFNHHLVKPATRSDLQELFAKKTEQKSAQSFSYDRPKGRSKKVPVR